MHLERRLHGCERPGRQKIIRVEPQADVAVLESVSLHGFKPLEYRIVKAAVGALDQAPARFRLDRLLDDLHGPVG